MVKRKYRYLYENLGGEVKYATIKDLLREFSWRVRSMLLNAELQTTTLRPNIIR
jgi:hypothetical protein